MLGTLAYLVALNAPEITTAAAEAGGYFAQAAGRNFAKGLADELSARLTSAGGPLTSSLLGAITGGGESISKSVLESVEVGVGNALKAASAIIVNVDELELLRELATVAATNGDVQAVVQKLKAFYASQKQ